MARTSRTRCCRSIAGRARSTRTTAPPSSRRVDGLAARIAEPLAVARLRHRRGQRPALAALRRRLLLQDLHVAALLLGQGLRAGHPRRGGPRQRADRAGSPTATRNRHAHCDVLSSAPARRALRRRSPRRETGQARHPRRRAGRARRHRCCTSTTSTIDGMPAQDLAGADARGARRAAPNVDAAAAHHRLRLLQPQPPRRSSSASPTIVTPPPPDLPRERLWQVRASEVVLATGAHERPLVFADNDRPGIMLAESVRAFSTATRVAPGRRIVFATSGASAYRGGARCEGAPGSTSRIVDLRAGADCGAGGARLRGRPASRSSPATPYRRPTGRKRVAGLIVAPIERRRPRSARRRTLACDCVGMSGGWTPAVHLFSQSRGKLRFDAELDAFVPGTVGAGGALGGRRAAAPTISPPASPKAAPPAHAAAGSATPRLRRDADAAPASSRCASCRPTPTRRRCAPSSTSRTTSPPRTSRSPCARASNPSSTSSATPRPAWRPTRARPRT